MRRAFLLLLASSLFSCATKKEIIYFQDADQLNDTSIQKAFEPIVEPNDILHISISHYDDNLVRPFNKEPLSQGNATSENLALQGYLVNPEGMINFPVLGGLEVGGKTRSEIEQMLSSRLKDYVSEAVVDVRILNFKITVLGGVNKPGVYTIRNERITLPEALGMAGDLTADGDRNNIKVLREQDGKRIVKQIDITSTEFYATPFFFLKQNDVVYVEPSLRGVKKSGFIPDIPALLSLVTVVLSAVIIITR